MTAEQFEQNVATVHGITVEERREQGYVILVCGCGFGGCPGFATTLRDQAECYINDLPGYHGYCWPELGGMNDGR